MKTTNYINKQREKVLEELGFVKEEGRYIHKLSGRKFDFSASSVEGIVMKIFDRGYKVGQKDKIKEIKSTLNIE